MMKTNKLADWSLAPGHSDDASRLTFSFLPVASLPAANILFPGICHV
jgi:hypothetical protein